MQDSAHSTRRGRNKVYEYLKKEIDLRDKRKPTKEDKNNQVSFINGGRPFSFFFCAHTHSRVEKSGLGFRKLNHDVAVVPRNSSVICQRLLLFWIKEG